MLKILSEKWGENKDKLREEIVKRAKFMNECGYKELVKLTFDVIFNPGKVDYEKLNTDSITEVDNGNYQGTLLFLIPFNTYQPCEYEYLMTYVGYGSCSGCDALQSIQDWGEESLSDRQVNDFMKLCLEIIENTIKPYNCGWREEDEFKNVEEK